MSSSDGVVAGGFLLVDAANRVISETIIASYGIHNQDITQESLQDAAETIPRSSSNSLTVTHQIVAYQDDFHSVGDQRPRRDERTIQLATGHSHTHPIVEEIQDDFNSDNELVTTPLNPDTTDANATSNSPRVEEQPPSDQARLTKIFLMITSQMAQTMLIIRISADSTSFSKNQNILFRSAAAFNAIGLLSLLFATLANRGLFKKIPQFARIATGTGFFCTAYSFIIIMGMTLLNDSEMLWVTGIVSMAFFPGFACVFME